MKPRSFIHSRRYWSLRCLAIWLGFCVAVVAGCGGKEPAGNSDAPPKVVLQLNWFPDAQHGGFYAALVHGEFAAEGLDVKILPGGPNVPIIQSVASRRVTFAIGNADQVLLGRRQDANVVALFAARPTSPRCILVQADSGIASFDDLRNMTLALGSGKAFAKFLQQELPLTNVRIVPYSGSIAALLQNKDYAQQGYVFSEPLVARRQGVEVRSLMVSDLGFNPYTSLLLAHGDLLKEDPELAGKMVRAVRRGWQRYLESPGETNREIQRLNSEMDLDSLGFGAAAIRPLCLPEGMTPEEIGQMDPQRWQTLAQQLAEMNLVELPLEPEAAFTNQFLRDE